MISKTVLNAFSFVVGAGFKLGAFPYMWDSVNQEVKPVSRKKLWHWYLTALYIFVNTCFMRFRLVQAASMEHISYGVLIMNLFNVATWLGTSVFNLNSLIFRHEVCAFMNQVLSIDRHLKNLNWTSPNAVKNESGAVLKCAYCLYFYSVCQSLISIRTMEKNPKYWFSLLGTQRTAKWKLIPFGIFESCMSGAVSSIALFYVFLVMSYVMLSRNCLNAMRHRKSDMVPKFYRMFQVLNAQFNFCSEKFIMPVMFFLDAACITICTYAAVRLVHEVKMPAYLGFPLVALASIFLAVECFHPAYKMRQASVRLVKSILETTPRPTYLSKVMISCLPIEVDVGTFYTIKQSTTMTFLGINVDNTVNLLLSC